MPLLKIQTNIDLTNDAKQNLAAKASQAMASSLGKPESYVMVLVQDKATMLLGGENMPMAFCEAKSIGLSDGQCAPLSKALCDVISQETQIEQSKIYIEFASAQGKHWGCNGTTF